MNAHAAIRPTPLTRRPGFRALICSLLCVAAIAGCGGSDDSPPATLVTPPAVQPPGAPVSATIGAAGATLAFTASGIASTLTFPAGSVPSDTNVTVTPLPPLAGEWARVQVTGPAGVLPAAAVWALQLPAGDAPAAGASGLDVSAGSTLPLPTRVDAAARRVSISVQAFGGIAANPALAVQQAAGGPVRALADGDSGTTLAAIRALPPAQMFAAVEETIRVHEREDRFATAFRAVTAVTAVQMAMEVGDATFAGQAAAMIDRLAADACARLNSAVAAATLVPVPQDFGADGLDGIRWRARAVEPIHYWHAIVRRLGGPACGADVAGALASLERAFAQASSSQLQTASDVVTFRKVTGPLGAAKELIARDAALGVPALGEQVRATTLEPTMPPLRVAAWDVSVNASTHDHYRDVFRIYGIDTPMAEDVQQARTRLQVVSRESGGQELGRALGGGTGRGQAVTVITVPARAGGTLELTGPIDVLHCPSPANERLVVEFENATVINRASIATKLLDGTESLNVSPLLVAAGIDTATEGTHTLRIKRVGSTCNAALGLSDAVLVQVRLDFLAGKAPPPSRITGRLFTGRMTEFYMPFDSGCSASCLERSPFPDRCPVIGYYDTTLTATGDPSRYSVTLRWKHSQAPADAPTLEDVFAGPGSPTSLNANWSSGMYLRNSQMQFSVDSAGALRGTIRYQCHLLAMDLLGP